MKPALIPSLRYENAPAAIDFLCRAFGFEKHAVYADEKNPNIIHHAELVLGDAMIMLGSDVPGETKERYHWKTPKQAGGITMSITAVIDDPDSHYLRAKAEGAEIVTEPHDNQGYPGRAYEARDLEGHAWYFGSYDPWAA